jgi:hypothetical protein
MARQRFGQLVKRVGHSDDGQARRKGRGRLNAAYNSDVKAGADERFCDGSAEVPTGLHGD